MKYNISLIIALIFLFESIGFAGGIKIPVGDFFGKAISKTVAKVQTNSTDIPNVLSKDELKNCLLDKEKIDVENMRINDIKRDLTQKERQLLTLENEISRLENVAYISEQIKYLNQKIKEYNTKLEVMKLDSQVANVKTENYNKKINEFKLKCGQKNYYQEDFDQIMLEKRK